LILQGGKDTCDSAESAEGNNREGSHSGIDSLSEDEKKEILQTWTSQTRNTGSGAERGIQHA